jgi:hypothetical protein
MATSDELEDERMESLRYLFLYFQKRFFALIPNPSPVGGRESPLPSGEG